MKHKRLTYRVLLAMALVLVVNFGLHRLYHRYMIINRVNEHQDGQFEALDGFDGVLLLGNSHNPLSPEIIGDAFCYASPRELFPQTYYKLKTILQDSTVRPEMVIMSVDASAFAPGTGYQMRFHDYWKKYVDFAEMAKYTDDDTYMRYYLQGKYCSYLGNYTQMWQSALLIKAEFTRMENGYRPPRDFRRWTDVVDKEKAGWERANSFVSSYKNSQPDPLMLDYFELILELCREHNIQVTLFRSPVTREYLESAQQIINYELFDSVIDSVTAQYPNVINTHTYRTLFLDNPEFFFNADHVNPRGADSLTRVIIKDLTGFKNLSGLEPYISREQ